MNMWLNISLEIERSLINEYVGLTIDLPQSNLRYSSYIAWLNEKYGRVKILDQRGGVFQNRIFIEFKSEEELTLFLLTR